MNKPSEKKAPTFSNFKPQTGAEPAPAAKDPVTDAAPRDVVEEPTPAKDAPLQAAKGDDEIMSRPQQEQQQHAVIPGADEIKGKWKQQVGAAKIAWGKLTEDELLKLEGQQQKLAGLVQERYAISRDEADKQVKAFFDTNKM